jgi:hypothetical protein
MLEILLISCVLFLILTFFYKQAVCEFRINQIEWGQRDTVHTLLNEKIPLVIRSLPPATFWTHEDTLNRTTYSHIPIFQGQTLNEWLQNSAVGIQCIWDYYQAELIAKASGLGIWANRWLNPVIVKPYMKWWLYPQYHCWAGNVGLRKTFATWNCLFPVDGEIVVTIMPENVEPSLPANWRGCFPGELTNKDTPFIGDLKFIDIILRPGNCLVMPAHWFWSWKAVDGSEKMPMTCTISYHTPISSLAFKLTPYK